MSCCGTRYRVKKDVINSEYKQQLPKIQEVKQDDVIRLPVEERKLFRCHFNLSQIIKPQYMIIATIDYTNINSQQKYQQFSKPLQKMVRQQSPIRQNKVKFHLRQKQIIRSGGVQIVKSDSDKRQVGEEDIDLKVIDQYKKETDKIKQKKDQQKEWEMMVI